MRKNNRVLLKISGEALEGTRDHGIDPVFIKELAVQIKEIKDSGFEIGIVLGGGNIFRGISGAANGMDRVAADYMGMLATVMNGVAMQDALESVGVETRLMSAIDIPEIGEKYIKRRGTRHMEKGRIVICVAGTGNPYFTTDSAGVLRALELECDLMIKATKVDGVFNKDPKKYTDAVLIKEATYDEVIKNDIKVMDQTAIALAKDGKLALGVVNLFKAGAMLRACLGEDEGTKIR
ncbi:MAG: UMP kinase [Candidatus Gracilibacteria bacterium]|nr:UMP kinase [Candidatus Gracilibacteria bacterium]